MHTNHQTAQVNNIYIIALYIYTLLDTTSKVKEYQPGDYFGELALINNEPRAASVKAEVYYKFDYYRLIVDQFAQIDNHSKDYLALLKIY